MPVFMMTRSWTAPHLSLAAVGLLARIAEQGSAETVNLVALTDGDPKAVEAIVTELIAARIIVNGEIVDPNDPGPSFDVPRPPRRAPVDTKVYYLVRHSDGAVKIGLTKVMGQRLRQLRDSYGSIELLATEVGTWGDERARHEQFAKLRLPRDRRLHGGSEWFMTGPALIRHIEALRVAEAVAP